MAKNVLDEYDRQTRREARQRVLVVYEYHYAAPGARATTDKLETIIRKLDFLLKED